MLPESDSAHCCRVLRIGEGDEVTVVDGKGSRFRCVIACAHPGHTMVEIAGRERVVPSWRQQITVAVAPTKNMDRMEWLVEKLTEVGVDRIIPIECARSERREIKTERLEKIAVSAMKQSLKATLPELQGMTPVRKAVELTAGCAQRFVGYCASGTMRSEFSCVYRPGADVTLFIGPEGDFTPEEIAAMEEAGISPVTFGDNRLRTETAALYGVSACHILDSIEKC